jgi:hypothetical protein
MSLSSNIHISRFNFENEKVPKCSSIIIQGKRLTGKTNLGAYVLQKLSENVGINQSMVFCVNHTRQKWANIVPPLNTFDVDIHMLNRIIDTQEKLINEDRLVFERDHPGISYSVPNRLCVALLFDDLGLNKDFNHDKLMKRLSMNRKELGIYPIWIVQNINQLCTEILENSDFIITTKCVNEKVLEKLYNEYVGSRIVSKQEFNVVFSATTKDMNMALLIDNSVVSTNVCDVLNYVVWPLRVV